MPFDGLPSPNYQNLEKIDQVIALLATPDRWCKGAERNRFGQHCIVGALRVVGALPALQPIVLRTIREVTGQAPSRIEAFNDAPKTTHAEVLQVLNRTREMILAGESGIDLSPVGITRGNWITRLWHRHVM